MRLFKITNYANDKSQIGWLLSTNSFNLGRLFIDVGEINDLPLVPGRVPWKQWVSSVTVLSEHQAPTIEELLDQIPEEFI